MREVWKLIWQQFIEYSTLSFSVIYYVPSHEDTKPLKTIGNGYWKQWAFPKGVQSNKLVTQYLHISESYFT